VGCSVVDEAASCSVSAADEDDDGHGSALCAAEPGLDCDDTNDTVYPGAAEVCDGLDNDCNGLQDLDDGLPLAGTPRLLTTYTEPAREPSIAWAPEAGVYGIVWTDERHDNEEAPNTEIYFCTVQPDGTFDTWPRRLTEAAGDSNAPDIEWGGDAFGVVWADSRDGSSSIYFGTVLLNGDFASSAQAVTSADEVGYSPTLAFTAEEWHVIWVAAAGQLNVSRRTSTGGNLGTLVMANDCGRMVGPKASVLDDQLGLTWVTPDYELNLWGRFSLSGQSVQPDTEQLDSDATLEPAIAANASGWALAWRASVSALSFTQRAPDGSELCTEPGVPVALLPSAVLPYPGGHLVVGRHGNSATTRGAAAVRFLSDCATPVDNQVLLLSATAGVYFGRSDAAVGEQGFGTVWHERNPDGVDEEPPNSVKFRAFGPRLCDEPTTSAE
jgi:hypothetical protein